MNTNKIKSSIWLEIKMESSPIQSNIFTGFLKLLDQCIAVIHCNNSYKQINM